MILWMIITLTEIIEDKTDNIKFFEIDDKILDKDLEMEYYEKSIYVIQNTNQNEISVSYGTIKEINKSEIPYSIFLCPWLIVPPSKNIFSNQSLIENVYYIQIDI